MLKYLYTSILSIKMKNSDDIQSWREWEVESPSHFGLVKLLWRTFCNLLKWNRVIVSNATLGDIYAFFFPVQIFELTQQTHRLTVPTCGFYLETGKHQRSQRYPQHELPVSNLWALGVGESLTWTTKICMRHMSLEELSTKALSGFLSSQVRLIQLAGLVANYQ